MKTKINKIKKNDYTYVIERLLDGRTKKGRWVKRIANVLYILLTISALATLTLIIVGWM